MDKILETVIRVDVEEKSPLRLVENVATGKYMGETVELNRTIDSAKHFIVFRDKVYVIDMMNVMTSVLDQIQFDDKGKQTA